MAALDSNTTGQVFGSTATDVASGLVPTHPLSNDHSFRNFIQAHLIAVTTPGTSDAFINACVAVLEGNHLWLQKASPDCIITE